MSKRLAALACAGLAMIPLAATAQTAAQDGPWMVRVRATRLSLRAPGAGPARSSLQRRGPPLCA